MKRTLPAPPSFNTLYQNIYLKQQHASTLSITFPASMPVDDPHRTFGVGRELIVQCEFLTRHDGSHTLAEDAVPPLR